jgi:hypothetical protein
VRCRARAPINEARCSRSRTCSPASVKASEYHQSAAAYQQLVREGFVGERVHDTVFISYRRDDGEAAYMVHSIYRAIKSIFGEEGVFLDVDSRLPGLSFPDKLQLALDSTVAVL